MIPKLPAGSRTPRPGISWFNAVADAVNAHQSRKTSIAPGQSFTHHPQALRVTVKNSTENDIGAFRPLDIDGITLPDNTEIVLNGVAGAGGLFVITQEPIAAGKFGSAVIQGLTKAYATGATAGQASSSDGALAFGSGRAHVIYDSDDAVTTERLVFVVLDNSEASSALPHLAYYKLLAEGGPVDLEFDWELVEIDTATTVASGSWVFGDTFAAMKTAIDTATGEDIVFYSAGPFPTNEVEIHVNRPFGFDKYEFFTTTTVITPATDAWAYFKTAICRMPGG